MKNPYTLYPNLLQEVKHKVPAMEAACKAASRTAQLLTKDTPQEEVSQMMAVMASVKEQLSKVCACHYTVCYSLV